MPSDDLQLLVKGAIAPLYYFHGDNTRLLDDALSGLKKHLFADEEADFDSDRFDAQSHAPAEVLMAARTMPVCFARRLVLVQRVDAWSDDELKKFEAYCSKPSAATCLVFTGTAEKKKLSGWLKKNGRVVACVNPRWDKDIRLFVQHELARHRKKASAGALALLCQVLNGNAHTMAGEIEKLVLYCRDRHSIDEPDVEQALCAGHRTTIFTLVDSIGEGRLDTSLACLKQLLDDGMPALQVLAMIARQFRLLARACEASPDQAGPARIRQLLGLKNDYLARGIIKQAANWSTACFGAVFAELSSADRQLKSSRKENRLMLEHLLLRLAGFRARPSAGQQHRVGALGQP